MSKTLLTQWLLEAAEEIENAHAFLDGLGVPRGTVYPEVPFTLAARIGRLVLDRDHPDVRESA